MKLIANSSFFVGVFLSASVLPAQVQAQTSGDSAPEEIIVVANRIGQSLSTVLAATTIIDKHSGLPELRLLENGRDSFKTWPKKVFKACRMYTGGHKLVGSMAKKVRDCLARDGAMLDC